MRLLFVLLLCCALILGGYYYIHSQDIPALPTHTKAWADDATYTIHFFDVGQGDAILVDCKSYEVLIDAGPSDSGIAAKITPYVNGNLEAVVMTHPHADHIGGLPSVFDTFTVDNFWKSTDVADSDIYNTVMSDINPKKVHLATTGDSIIVGPMEFNILNTAYSTDINENSIVLELDALACSCLFMGDAGKTTELRLLNADLIHDVDILKIGHHGSSSASGLKLIQTAAPEVAVYSAGIGNTYGHPVAAIINLYKKLGVTVYGTDVNGDIWVDVTGENYTVYETR